MRARLLSWWRKARKPFEVFAVFVGCLMIIALLVVLVLAYIFNVDVPGLRGKTLWDWLQLLIIPAVLAIGGYLFSFTTSRNEREIAQDNQRETALQEYIDKMSELILHEKLRESQPKDEVRNIARVRTLTVLPRLDGSRKRSVLQFLHESGLINKNTSIIDLKAADLGETNLYLADQSGTSLWTTDLSGADLREVNLSRANLSYAKLRKVDLRRADLQGANLIEADLSESDLREADLTLADLSDADLYKANVSEDQLNKVKSLKGATMPNGSKNP